MTLLSLLAWLSVGAAAPADPDTPWLSAALRDLQVRAAAGVPMSPRLDLRASPRPDGVTVVAEVLDDEQALAWLIERGVSVEAAGPGLVQARVPWAQVDGLAALPGLRWARPPHLASPKGRFEGGAIETEGAAAAGVAAWHAQDLDGRSVEVAVVDVGFAGWEDLAGVEIPPSTTWSSDAELHATAHGTAVAEVIADLAPRAQLRLLPFRTDVEYIELLGSLEGQTDVVNASIGFDNIWPADGTSAVSRAAERLVQSGVAYVAAAGNEVGRYRIGPLSSDSGEATAAIGGSVGWQVRAPGNIVAVSLRWSEPMDRPTWDLDLFAWPDRAAWEAGEPPCASSTEAQGEAGVPPYEALAAGCDSDERAWVVVEVARPGDGDLAELDGFLYAPAGFRSGVDALERTLTLPADTPGVLAVGACLATEDGYAAGGPPEGYSSRGPTEDGRLKPELCAASAVSTATYGERGFPGTSASAPHVAGLVALTMDGEGLRGAPEAVTARLQARAQDLGDAGPDVRYGAGGARLGDPPARCRCSTTPLGAATWGLLGALCVLARRRLAEDATGR